MLPTNDGLANHWQTNHGVSSSPVRFMVRVCGALFDGYPNTVKPRSIEKKRGGYVPEITLFNTQWRAFLSPLLEFPPVGIEKC